MLKTEELKLVSEWDKTFPKSEKVDHEKVTFVNRYGITLAADLYKPKNAFGKYPAIAVSGPFGAVKEQCSGLYAQTMAEKGNGQVSVTVAGRMNAFEAFVRVQSDAALRQVAGEYAYDDNEHDKNELTLRGGGEEINNQLEHQLNERLAMAGMEVVEARINYLAYAPEIAAVMLRRQQASAIITAREKIVEGAVSMVKMALDKLSEEEIVELDEEKKAAMVSNLLVVLCADEPAQPVINSGTLNH